MNVPENVFELPFWLQRDDVLCKNLAEELTDANSPDVASVWLKVCATCRTSLKACYCGAPTQNKVAAVWNRQTGFNEDQICKILENAKKSPINSPAPAPVNTDTTKAVTFADRAKIVLSLASGTTVIPVPPNSKATKVGTSRRSRDANQIAKWNEARDSNCAAVCSYDEGGIWVLDDDLGTLIELIKRETGHDLSQYFRVKTADGNHFYFLHDDSSRAVRYGKSENSSVIDVPGYKGEARCNMQYVMSPLSVHPSGHVYTIVNDVPLVPAPVWLLDWLKQKHALSESLKKSNKKTHGTVPLEASDIPKLGVVVNPDKSMTIYPNPPHPGFKALFDKVGWTPLLERLQEDKDPHYHNATLGVGEPNTFCPIPSHVGNGDKNTNGEWSPCFGVMKDNPALLHCFVCGWTGDLVKAINEYDGYKETMFDTARTICEEEDLKFEDFFPEPEPSFEIETPEQSFSDVDLNRNDEVQREYDMTKSEIEEQNRKEYPVYRLHESAGPRFDESILYGPVGEVAKHISQYNESHIASIYLNLIVSLGNAMGRNPYFKINKTEHYPNEFLACVGESSYSRKGTGADEVDAFLGLVDGDWMRYRNSNGFETPQAVINQIRDASTFQTFDKRSKQYKTVTTPGVDDKRLCIREGELSNLFKLMGDFKTRTDEKLRAAWDGKPLRNQVAGKTEAGESKSIICEFPHVSIVGYTTLSLVKKTIPQDADTSGTGNRFLWCYMKRLKLVPNGGPEIDWGSLTIDYKGAKASFLVYFYEMLQEAKKPRNIPVDKSARNLWRNLYLTMERTPWKGFVGRMTSRGAAHVRRLATILCLIDREDTLKAKHIQAAVAIWEYSRECARFIFVGYSREQERIIRFAREKGAAGIILSDLHNLFNRNKSAEWIRAEMAALVEGGWMTPNGDGWKFKKV